MSVVPPLVQGVTWSISQRSAGTVQAGKVQCPFEAAMTAAHSTFDLIIDTVPVSHALDPYLPLLDVDGTLVIVGQVGPMEGTNTVPLLLGRRRIAGSPIGGIAETQEMLDFCAEHGIAATIEVVSAADVNEVWDRVVDGDVRYRAVIDTSTITPA